MPIEINELVLRTVVRDPRGVSSDSKDSAAAVSDSTVNACVAEVLKILRKRLER